MSVEAGTVYNAGIEILVVDDSDSNRQVAKLILERLGCRVETAKDGDEAVSLISAKRFDAVFMDCQMPFNGLDATKLIREKERISGCHVSVIAYTAQAMEGDREKCLDAGMDGYISKPASVSDFAEAIEQIRMSLV